MNLSTLDNPVALLHSLLVGLSGIAGLSYLEPQPRTAEGGGRQLWLGQRIAEQSADTSTVAAIYPGPGRFALEAGLTIRVQFSTTGELTAALEQSAAIEAALQTPGGGSPRGAASGEVWDIPAYTLPGPGGIGGGDEGGTVWRVSAIRFVGSSGQVGRDEQERAVIVFNVQVTASYVPTA